MKGNRQLVPTSADSDKAGSRAPGYAVAVALVRRIGIVGTLATLAAIFAITLQPEPFDDGHGDRIVRILGFLHGIGVPESFGYYQLEFTANIIMFAPLGLFLALALAPQHRWIGLAALPLLSGAIELAQLLFLPTRYPSLQDVFANSAGGWIGVAVVMLVGALRRRRSAPSASHGPS